MRPNVEQMLRAAIALQVGALEYGEDESGTQAEARQAVIGMRKAIDVASNTLASMQRSIEQRRKEARNNT